MNTNDFISNVTANLEEWGVDYSEDATALTIGSVALEVSEEQPTATITDGDYLVAITSDADKASALLAFPLARKAWDAGYTGDFEVDVHDGMVDMRLSYGSSGLCIYAVIDSDLEFTVVDHPLFGENVDMTDLEAALTSTQLAYQAPEEAWQALCGATDFEQDDWSSVVELFHWRARFDYGNRLTKVSTSESENVALVEDYDPESPIRVIDVDTVRDVACWSPGDTAAAVLYAIS